VERLRKNLSRPQEASQSRRKSGSKFDAKTTQIPAVSITLPSFSWANDCVQTELSPKVLWIDLLSLLNAKRTMMWKCKKSNLLVWKASVRRM
jgi:hypothetical protein